MSSKQSDWFKIKDVAKGVFVIEETGHVQSYLVNGKDVSALIDTGTGLLNIREAIQPLLRDDVIVLNTHWHFDHVGGNVLFDRIGIAECESKLIQIDLPNMLMIEIYVKPALEEGLLFPEGLVLEEYEVKGSRPSFYVKEGDTFDLGGRILEAIATPGHTHGSLSFLDRLTGSLFVGDLVYRGPLYAHLEDSDLEEYIGSVSRLLCRRHEFVRLYPGHGDYPLERDSLDATLAALMKIKAGALPDTIAEFLGERCNCYHFDGFEILTRILGVRGFGPSMLLEPPRS